MNTELNTLLVSMPFGAWNRPALGISLLKSEINKRSHTCEIRYLWKEFSEQIGFENYKFLTDEVPYTCFAGDWCFTLPLNGRRPVIDLKYVTEILHKTWRLTSSDIKRIVAIREQTPHYLSHCLKTVDWSNVDIVGFTSTFSQNLASLALAKELKAKYPNIQIVFGGANWEADMGQSLFESYPFVDFVCQGESDQSFPALIESLAGGTPPTCLPPNVLGRSASVDINTNAGNRSTVNMDELPYPDFSDFFSMMSEVPFQEVLPTLLMETSRGCWWGAKSHCTFCGLNGENMHFRSKSADRALDELGTLVRQYRTPIVSFVDNILDMKYFNTFLPELTQSELDIDAFFEVKSNLSRAQVKTLSESGIRHIQPGIESLSDPILTLMRKGSSCIQNIQLLKWCREYDVSVDWNILYGFPGETNKHYIDMFEVFPLLEHLTPPSAIGPIRLDRFSPYYSEPEMHGLTNVRAMEVYRYLYPFDAITRNRIAPYFDFDWVTGSEPTTLIDELNDRVEKWRHSYDFSELNASDDGLRCLINDTRGSAPKTFELSGIDRWIYGLCDKAKTVKQLTREISTRALNTSYEQRDVERLLGWFAENRLVYQQDGRFLALATYDNFPAEFNESLPPHEACECAMIDKSFPIQVIACV